MTNCIFICTRNNSLHSVSAIDPLKGHSSPETSVAYIKDLYEPTLKWPFVPLKCFSLPRNLTLLY